MCCHDLCFPISFRFDSSAFLSDTLRQSMARCSSDACFADSDNEEDMEPPPVSVLTASGGSTAIRRDSKLERSFRAATAVTDPVAEASAMELYTCPWKTHIVWRTYTFYHACSMFRVEMVYFVEWSKHYLFAVFVCVFVHSGLMETTFIGPYGYHRISPNNSYTVRAALFFSTCDCLVPNVWPATDRVSGIPSTYRGRCSTQ